MKINRVLFPEIIRGLRGDRGAIDFYLHQMKSVKKATDPATGATKWAVLAHGHVDPPWVNHIITSKMLRDRGGHTYYVGKEFAAALSQIDRQLPLQVLPQHFIGYIQFARGALFDDTGEIDGATVWISDADDMGYTCEPGVDPKTVRSLSINYGNVSDVEGVSKTACKFSSILSAKHLSELFHQEDVKDCSLEVVGYQPQPEKRVPVLRAIINAVVYLHSSDPEIQKLRPLLELSHSKRSAERQLQPVANETRLPVTLLHWGLHEPRQYTVDSTWVRPHFRWQRCGPQLASVKLTMVREHERRYGETTDDADPTPEAGRLPGQGSAASASLPSELV